jgi:hypothetical protein
VLTPADFSLTLHITLHFTITPDRLLITAFSILNMSASATDQSSLITDMTINIKSQGGNILTVISITPTDKSAASQLARFSGISQAITKASENFQTARRNDLRFDANVRSSALDTTEFDALREIGRLTQSQDPGTKLNYNHIPYDAGHVDVSEAAVAIQQTCIKSAKDFIVKGLIKDRSSGLTSKITAPVSDRVPKSEESEDWAAWEEAKGLF